MLRVIIPAKLRCRCLGPTNTTPFERFILLSLLVIAATRAGGGGGQDGRRRVAADLAGRAEGYGKETAH